MRIRRNQKSDLATIFWAVYHGYLKFLHAGVNFEFFRKNTKRDIFILDSKGMFHEKK